MMPLCELWGMLLRNSFFFYELRVTYDADIPLSIIRHNFVMTNSDQISRSTYAEPFFEALVDRLVDCRIVGTDTYSKNVIVVENEYIIEFFPRFRDQMMFDTFR